MKNKHAAKLAANINAGIIITTQFRTSSSDEFKEYVSYMDRKEAIQTERTAEYSLFNEYMDNPEKTSGLFTVQKDDLTEGEKQQLKSIFELAQRNDSLMWQTVISFDNSFLEENGLYDSESGRLDEIKIKELTRGSMRRMLQSEKMEESSVWSAAIHYNTDNIHIHIATVEPFPQRERILEGKYAGQVKGTWKMSSINAGRSYIANNILDTQMENQRINDIIRENIIESKKKHPLHKDKDLAQKFMEIHSKMPADKRKWNYNMNALKNIRPELDELTALYIEKYHADDFEELKKLLKDQEDKYSRAYGGDEKNHLAENKIKDLYSRMGNTILKEMKNYDRDIKRIAYEEAVKQKRLTQNSQRIKDDFKNENKNLDEDDVKPYIKKPGSGSKKMKIKFKNYRSCMNLSSLLSSLKKSMREEYKHRRNQYEHEAMIKAAEKELESTTRSDPKNTPDYNP